MAAGSLEPSTRLGPPHAPMCHPAPAPPRAPLQRHGSHQRQHAGGRRAAAARVPEPFLHRCRLLFFPALSEELPWRDSTAFCAAWLDGVHCPRSQPALLLPLCHPPSLPARFPPCTQASTTGACAVCAACSACAASTWTRATSQVTLPFISPVGSSGPPNLQARPGAVQQRP